MTERKKEIGLHKDMLRAQAKSMEADRQTASSEVQECISKIDKLRKRYEIITVAMAPPEGEEEHSQAYYVIKVRKCHIHVHVHTHTCTCIYMYVHTVYIYIVEVQSCTIVTSIKTL